MPFILKDRLPDHETLNGWISSFGKNANVPLIAYNVEKLIPVTVLTVEIVVVPEVILTEVAYETGDTGFPNGCVSLSTL